MSRSQITLDTILIMEDSTDPISLGGVAAPIGSIFSAEDGSGVFLKTGSGDNDWEPVGSGSNEQVIGAAFSGSGGVINISSVVTLISRFNGTITGWRVAGGDGETGSCVIDLSAGGVSLIGGGNKPTISSGNSANASISGWTDPIITQNTIYEITIDSLSSFNRLVVYFYFTI